MAKIYDKEEYLENLAKKIEGHLPAEHYRAYSDGESIFVSGKHGLNRVKIIPKGKAFDLEWIIADEEEKAELKKRLKEVL